MDNNRSIIDNRLFVYGILVEVLAGITTFTLPYQGKGISDTIIPVIRSGNTRIYLSGLLPLSLIIWSSNLIVKSGRYKNRLLVALFLLFLALPALGWAMNLMKAPVYIMSSGAKGIVLEETNLNVYGENKEVVVVFNAEVRSYINDESDVFIYLELPEVMKDIVENNRILVNETMGLDRGHRFSIEYEGNIDISDGYNYEDFFELDYHNEDYIIIIDDGVESYKMTMNDGLF